MPLFSDSFDILGLTDEEAETRAIPDSVFERVLSEQPNDRSAPSERGRGAVEKFVLPILQGLVTATSDNPSETALSQMQAALQRKRENEARKAALDQQDKELQLRRERYEQLAAQASAQRELQKDLLSTRLEAEDEEAEEQREHALDLVEKENEFRTALKNLDHENSLEVVQKRFRNRLSAIGAQGEENRETLTFRDQVRKAIEQRELATEWAREIEALGVPRDQALETANHLVSGSKEDITEEDTRIARILAKEAEHRKELKKDLTGLEFLQRNPVTRDVENVRDEASSAAEPKDMSEGSGAKVKSAATKVVSLARERARGRITRETLERMAESQFPDDEAAQDQFIRLVSGQVQVIGE